MKRCNTCIKYEVLHTLCEKCKDLNEFDALMSGDATELPKIDLGQSVSVEEKEALWSEDDEKRMDIIGPNGNEGDHYKHVVRLSGRQQGKTHGKNFTHTRTVAQTMGDEPIPNDLAANRGLDGYNS